MKTRDTLLHAEQLARMAGVHKSTILLAIRRGELHASRTVGRSARIAVEDARRYLLERNKELPPELEQPARRATLAVLAEGTDALQVVQRALPSGFEVLGTNGLYGSLIAVGSRAPDVIVVDLDMVFMNPIGLVRSLRASPNLRAAQVVAVGLRDDLFGAARAAGAHAVVVKLDERTLHDLLARYVDDAAKGAAS